MYMSVLLKFQVFQALSVSKKATLHKILIFNDRHSIKVAGAVKPGDKKLLDDKNNMTLVNFLLTNSFIT